ncbi:hypothetical protein CAPTEDRAFT_207988 [Capitella teleta]|uniref:P-type domain-containing protein n=1 Tax=Capitella teleta TaxID=283909 RepID=R7TUN4_CAPTE|nr:hypothetical protein CAPTEDRAFT_207988 [Capitella teleta]|eukprot:ELT94730.1 hypothetical protein CAPTEDRAFT_207988 [Capitella teleta]
MMLIIIVAHEDDERCAIDRSERVDCGANIKEPDCLAIGCCWSPLEDGSAEPWCFVKRPLPSTTATLDGTSTLFPVADVTATVDPTLAAENTTLVGVTTRGPPGPPGGGLDTPKNTTDGGDDGDVVFVPTVGYTESTDDNDSTVSVVMTTVVDDLETTSERAPSTSLPITSSHPQTLTPLEEETPGNTATTPQVVTATDPQPSVTNATESSDNICADAKLMDAPERYYQNPGVEGRMLCDNATVEGWYAFQINGSWAEIPTACLKNNLCSTELSSRIDLLGQPLPNEGETIVVEIHMQFAISAVVNCSAIRKKGFKMRNCSDHFAYYLSDSSDRCPASFCLKNAGEKIPYRYLADPPVTSAPTTAAVTTQAEISTVGLTETVSPPGPPDVPYVDLDKITSSQDKGIVTVEYKYPNQIMSQDFVDEFDTPFRRMVAAQLNKLLPPAPTVKVTRPPQIDPVTKKMNLQIGREAPDMDQDASGAAPGKRSVRNRWRREATVTPATSVNEIYSKDNVFYVSPLPRVINNVLQASILVIEPDNENEVVSTKRLMAAFDSLNSTDQLQTETKLSLITYYPDLPRDLRPSVGELRGTVWQLHRDLLIVVIILAILCLIIIIIGLCCIKCKGNGAEKLTSDPEKGKKKKKPKRKTPPTVVENPISDEEMTRDEVPMLEHAHPAYTPNGSGQHLRDDEDGLIVPLDQMTAAELAQPELENTRL